MIGLSTAGHPCQDLKRCYDPKIKCTERDAVERTGIMTPVSQLQGHLHSDDYEVIGDFTACFCKTASDLFGEDHFSSDDIAILHALNYPLVYLRKLKIHSSLNRGMGHGSRLIEQFRQLAIGRGAKSAFARISDPETSKEKLVKFYSDNGWKMMPEDKIGEPRFAVCDFDTP